MLPPVATNKHCFWCEENGWRICVDEDLGFQFDAVGVTVIRQTPRSATVYGHDGKGILTSTEHVYAEPSTDERLKPTFYVPLHARQAIGHALIDQEPASEQLVKELRTALEHERKVNDQLRGAVIAKHLSR